MPAFSRFTPLGHLGLSGAPSHGEQIYRSIVSSLGGNYAVTPGSRQDAWCYAMAMGAARAWYAMERGANQAWAAHIGELLSVKEREYGITPGPNDTHRDRHAVLAARMMAPVAGTYGNIVAALQRLLGSDFIEYRPTAKADAVVWPATCGAQPMNLQMETVPRHLLSLVSPPTVGLGGSLECEYRLLDPEPFLNETGTLTSPLEVGEALVLEPGNLTLSERVTVTALRRSGTESPSTTRFFFTAVITKPHHTGDLATSAPWPLWVSTQGHSLVILRAHEAASDPDKRRRIDELMARMVRGVSTWAITSNEDTFNTGPFRVNRGRIGITTIGAL